jgi:glycosyltransferase involved in cell wall biosynthesis
MGLRRETPSPHRRIKIIHLITDLDPGGAEMMLYKLLSVMDREAFDQQVVSLTRVGVIGEEIRALGWPVDSLGMKRGVPSPAAFLKLTVLLRKEKPNILQTWLYHADLLGTLVKPWIKRARLVWNIRCSYMDFSRYPYLTRRVVQVCTRLSSRPDAVIINSKAGRELHIRRGYRPRRWVWIPNGFDVNQFRFDPAAREEVRHELGLTAGAPLIGMIARLDPMKDMDTFLRAAVRLQEKVPGVFFLLAGSGQEPNHPFFRDHPLGKVLGSRLFLLGYRKDIPRILSALDLAVSTSLGEGFPNAVGEAMACGIPCVVTDVGDSSFLLGEGGIAVPPGDAEGMAAAWERLLGLSVQERRMIGRKGRQRIETSFNLEGVRFRYERLYRDLMGEKSCQGIRDESNG